MHVIVPLALLLDLEFELAAAPSTALLRVRENPRLAFAGKGKAASVVVESSSLLATLESRTPLIGSTAGGVPHLRGYHREPTRDRENVGAVPQLQLSSNAHTDKRSDSQRLTANGSRNVRP